MCVSDTRRLHFAAEEVYNNLHIVREGRESPVKKWFRRLIAAVCTLALCLVSAGALSVEQAVDLLEEYYVDRLPAAAYEAATLDELFEAVGDPYTYYMSAEDYEEFNSQVESEGSITGIGAGIEYTADGIRITSLLDGGGAKEVGLQVGDCIIAIDGVGCVPGSEAHRSLIAGGGEGTYVTLTVRRTDGSVRGYRIERRVIPIHNTKVTLKDGVAVIDCDSFGSQTQEYFYDGIEQNDEKADHWVVDLRGNHGGLADAAVGTLGYFTGAGPKLYFRLADGRSFFALFYWDAMTDKPVVVLVDGQSASASEIFSAGIRAEGAGIVIGSRTYGKGTAQLVLDQEEHSDLFDGDALKVTAYRFYCSDGGTTDKIGVVPTLLVADEYAASVAALLRMEKPDSGEYLRFKLNGCEFYVDLAQAQTEENRTAFRELLAAIPPDVAVRCTVDGAEALLDADLTARQLGVEGASRRFSDISSSAYAMEIDILAVYGMLVGDGAGHFFPQRTLTRAELAAMLSQALNVASSVSAGFSDVAEGSWYADDVNAVVSLGLMNGVGGGRFDPKGSLTQEQLIAIMGRLARFLNFHADDYALGLTDADLAAAPIASLHAWARTEASVMSDFRGSMLHTALAEIDPKAPVTREQAAATLCRLLKTLDILPY